MKLVLVGLLLGTALCVNALGQGSRVPVPERNPINNPSANGSNGQTLGPGESGAYSHSVSGQVLTVDSAGNSMVVNLQGKRMQLLIQKDTRLRADKNTELAGKTDISVADYKPGQTVKVIYRIADSKILEIKLKRPKS
jgi:hypothetical protein